jgi:PAS domain S-box-containing protein
MAITVHYIVLTERNRRKLGIAEDSLATETLQREEAQDALYSTAENFTHLVENIREVVWIIDIIDGRARTAFYSPNYAETLGYSVDELYKNPNRWVKDVHPDDQQLIRETFADIYQESFDLEYRIIRRSNQQVRWIRARGSLIPGLNRIVGTIEDISDEVATRESKQELEKQLLQTQKMEALGSLAGGIAHDFNNILAIILGNTELQRELVGDNPKLVKQLESISYATNRGADLVKEILSFSRQSDTEPEVIELDSAIKETIQVFKPGIPADVELQYINNIRNARILADENQIKQVILNLCINACQAMNAGSGFLNIVVSRNNSHSNMVRIEITDTGEGMEEGVKKRMFDPFFTTRKDKGNTGLGLSSTLGIVELHGGSIEVESNPGKGTRVTLRLPTTSSPSSAKTTKKPKEKTGATLNIIFIDDEPDIVNLYQLYFRQENYNVVTFDDTRDALAHFLSTPDEFDVIVTDQTMPLMSGTDFAREVRKVNSHIPIILVTGHTDAMTPEVARDLGITRFVYKPIQLEELSGIIVDCVDKSHISTNTIQITDGGISPSL